MKTFSRWASGLYILASACLALPTTWAQGDKLAEGLFIDEPAPASASALAYPGSKRAQLRRLNTAWFIGDTSPLRSAEPAQLRLNLFPDVQVTANLTEVEWKDAQRVACSGELLGVDAGEVVLAFSQDVAHVYITIPKVGAFEVAGEASGLHRVIEIDPDADLRCGAEPGQWSASAGHSPTMAEAAATDSLFGVKPGNPGAKAATYIDLVVVYTTAAKNGAGGVSQMTALVDAAVTQANTIFQNSQLDVRYRLVYQGEVAYTETGSCSSDLGRLMAYDEFLEEVHTLRDDYGADCVSLITETGDAGIAGIGYIMCDVAHEFEDAAYTVVRRQWATSNSTFAHELGHNLGCNHNPEVMRAGHCSSYPYSYGHQFLVNGVLQRTVMAYQPGNLVLHFSNPSVNYQGVATGVADSRDNARTIRNTMATVAAFREPNSPAPTIGSLLLNPNPVSQDGNLLLSARNVADVDGTVRRVEYYHDSNGSGVLEPGTDLLLGYSIDASTSYLVSYSARSFAGGTQRFFARAQDNAGKWSNPATASCVVNVGSSRPGNHLTICGTFWSDARGDKDGVIEGLERVSLAVQLQATANLQNVEAHLSSRLANLRITDLPVYYPAISAGQCVSGGSNFEMLLDVGSYSNARLVLLVAYDTGGFSYTQEFTLLRDFVLNGEQVADFDVLDWQVDDSTAEASYNNGDGRVQSGERVLLRPRLKNIGNAGATDIEVNLAYSGPELTLETASEFYPDLAAGMSDYPISGHKFTIYEVLGSFSGTACLDARVIWSQNSGGVLKTCEIPLVVEPAGWLRLGEEQWDFGVAAPGSPVSHTIQIRNTGSAGISITGLQFSHPDTTSPTTASEPLPWSIPSGGSKSAVVTITTTGLTGRITRTVTVTTNGRIRTPGTDDQFKLTGMVGDLPAGGDLPTGVGAQYPDISGDWIVWEDARNGSADIFGYNIASGSEVSICTATGGQSNPRISGNLVAWNDSRNAGGQPGNVDIYAYDLNAPALGTFPVSTDTHPETLVGVSGNLVALVRVYQNLTGSGARDVQDLVVYEYLGNAIFREKYHSHFAPGDTSHPTQSFYSDGDFQEGLLVCGRNEVYWTTSGIPTWTSRDQHIEVIDFAAGETAPRRVSSVSNIGYLAAASHRFVFTKDDASGDNQIWVWRSDNSVQQLTFVPDFDPGDDVVGVGGPDGSDLLVYNYRSLTRPGLYFLDRGQGNQEYVILPVSRPDALRVDGLNAVWLDTSDGNKIRFAMLKQADVAVSGIAATPNTPSEGQAFSVSVVLQNLTSIAVAGNIEVRLYDGSPFSGGTPLRTNVVSGGLVARASTSTLFTNLRLSRDGQHQIYARIAVPGKDNAVNNIAATQVEVLDSDVAGPVISAVTISERNGDGDGLVGSDEQMRLSWTVADPSGIGSAGLLVGSTSYAVSSNGNSYWADVPALPAGPHQAKIWAIDADTSPAGSTNVVSFDILTAERITVFFDNSPLTNASPVILGTFLRGESTEQVFLVLNEGEQALRVGPLTVSGGLTKRDPLATNLPPGGFTYFTIRPDTAVLGPFAGTVSLVNSDSPRSPFTFSVTGLVTNPPTRPNLGIGSLPGGSYLLTVRGEAGHTYMIDVSTNLTDWSLVYSNTSASGTTLFTDTNRTQFRQRFYRGRMLP